MRFHRADAIENDRIVFTARAVDGDKDLVFALRYRTNVSIVKVRVAYVANKCIGHAVILALDSGWGPCVPRLQVRLGVRNENAVLPSTEK